MAPAEKDFEIDGFEFPLTIRALSLDERLGAANGSITPSELFARVVKDDEGKRMSSVKWDRFLVSSKDETTRELFEAINSFGGGDTDEDLETAKKS